MTTITWKTVCVLKQEITKAVDNNESSHVAMSTMQETHTQHPKVKSGLIEKSDEWVSSGMSNSPNVLLLYPETGRHSHKRMIFCEKSPIQMTCESWTHVMKGTLSLSLFLLPSLTKMVLFIFCLRNNFTNILKSKKKGWKSLQGGLNSIKSSEKEFK